MRREVLSAAIRALGSSPPVSRSSFGSATTRAPFPGAMRRSGTWTTSSLGPKEEARHSRTDRVCANAATTTGRPPGGGLATDRRALGRPRGVGQVNGSPRHSAAWKHSCAHCGEAGSVTLTRNSSRLGIQRHPPGAPSNQSGGHLMTGKKLVQILKAIAYPFARLYDLVHNGQDDICLLYTSDAADDLLCVDLGGRR